MNTNEAKIKQVLAVAAQKRRKTFKEKRRAVAREGGKARKDAIDAIAAQQVRQGGGMREEGGRRREEGGGMREEVEGRRE
jgi:hypothetical protein